MPNNKNPKGKFIEKLHMILDDPYNNTNIDEKTLIALRARLIDDRNGSMNRTFGGKDSLKATISIHKKLETLDLQSLPEFREVELSDHQNMQKCDPFQDEDVYEVEKITTFIPLPDESLVTQKPGVPIPHDTKKAVFEPAEEDLPEWEPVEEDKKTDFIESAPSESIEEFKPVEKKTPIKEKEVKIEVFKDIPSIDDKTAVLLFNNNYCSIDDLKKVSAKELSKIKGINKTAARKIIKDLEKNLIKNSPPVFTPVTTESPISEIKEVSEWEPVKQEKEKSVATTSDGKESESEEWEPISKKELESSKKTIKKLKEKREGASSKIKKTAKKEVKVSEEKIVSKKASSPLKTDDKIDVFKHISSIDDKTAKLLFENGINSVEFLSVTPIKKLTKIRGIKKKVAREIKKEVVEFLKKPIEEKPISFTPEAISPKSKSEKVENDEWEIRETEGYKHGAYTLFKKEIIVGFDKKRVIHFFSKSIPDDGEAVELPDGYEVRINKATGVPYLKKK